MAAMLASLTFCSFAVAETAKLAPLPTLPKVDDAKARLGYLLFFDARLSGDAANSCATCHDPAKGWGDGKPLSAGYTGVEYFRNDIGLDYSVAFDLHLYHYAVRDMISWVISGGYSALNYDPKLHLRHQLDQIDLYVRHTSWGLNLALKWALPILEPTHCDQTLRRFPNYQELR